MSEEEKLLIMECIYTECKEAFLNERDRQKTLESRANTYLSIYSVILGFGFLKAEDMLILFKKTITMNYMFGYIIFVIGLLLFYSLIRGLWMVVKAIQLHDYGSFPYPDELIDYMKNKSKLIYLRSLSVYFARQVKRNEEKNSKKAAALKESFIFIRIAFICLLIIILDIIALKINGG